MSSMLDAPPAASRGAPAAAVVGTIAAHGALLLLASIAGVSTVVDFKALMPVTEMVEVTLPREPEPPPPEPPAKATPTTAAAHVPPRPAEPEPPPPSAAQAGQILDTKSDAVDFGDQFVTGAGDSYAGGTTDAAGTSKTAVTDSAARGAGPAAPRVVAPVVDLSRPPKLAGGSLWQCPFPIEADDADIHHAVVTLRFEIGADGSVQSVRNTNDPGSGFAREARRCAGATRWNAALDRAGRAAPGVAIVNVRFDRQ